MAKAESIAQESVRILPRLAPVLFFASGAAGLVYEVVWSRLLQEIFGLTAHAVAVVLATHLCGLAIGSRALGRAADKRENPLRLYGLLELGIAATALLGTPAIRFFHVAAASRFAPDSAALAAYATAFRARHESCPSSMPALSRSLG